VVDRKHETGVQVTFSSRANEHRTSRSCIHCKQEDMTKSGEHAYCMRCESLAEVKQRMHKDKLGAQHIRRSSVSSAKERQRPLDPRIPPGRAIKGHTTPVLEGV
jgi:tRNA1(Val) A37 N6-methylase TrmN6